MPPLESLWEMRQLSSYLPLPARESAMTTLGNLRAMTGQGGVWEQSVFFSNQADSCQDIHCTTQAQRAAPRAEWLQQGLDLAVALQHRHHMRPEKATGFVTKSAVLLPSNFKIKKPQTQRMNKSGCIAHPPRAQQICIRQTPCMVTQTACPLRRGSAHALLALTRFPGTQPCQR